MQAHNIFVHDSYSVSHVYYTCSCMGVFHRHVLHIHLLGYLLKGTICYDDGCHLKKYVEKRKELTETTKRLASCQIVIDKMHFRGHVDKWCQENCNPYKAQQLNDVSMQVCIMYIYIKEAATFCVTNVFIWSTFNR